MLGLVDTALVRAGIQTTPRPWKTLAAIRLLRDQYDMYADWSAWREWVQGQDDCDLDDWDDQDVEIDQYIEHWRQAYNLTPGGIPCLS